MYEIEIEDWEIDYFFALNNGPKDLFTGGYMGHSNVTLIGNLLSPYLEKASKAKVEIRDDPEKDDYCTKEQTIISAKAIGWMEIPRGDDTLIFYCTVPCRSLPFIVLAAKAKKIKYVSTFGTKLKWRKGTIEHISLSGHREA